MVWVRQELVSGVENTARIVHGVVEKCDAVSHFPRPHIKMLPAANGNHPRESRVNTSLRRNIPAAREGGAARPGVRAGTIWLHLSLLSYSTFTCYNKRVKCSLVTKSSNQVQFLFPLTAEERATQHVASFFQMHARDASVRNTS